MRLAFFSNGLSARVFLLTSAPRPQKVGWILGILWSRMNSMIEPARWLRPGMRNCGKKLKRSLEGVAPSANHAILIMRQGSRLDPSGSAGIVDVRSCLRANAFNNFMKTNRRGPTVFTAAVAYFGRSAFYENAKGIVLVR